MGAILSLHNLVQFHLTLNLTKSLGPSPLMHKLTREPFHFIFEATNHSDVIPGPRAILEI